MGCFRFEILVVMVLVSVVYGGYFSSHSGSVLNRNGKRSYLFDLIQNKDDQAGLYEQPRLDAYNVADKLSFRKSFNKFGRRSDNELLKEAFIDFLSNIDEAELLALMSQKSSHEGVNK